MGEMGGGGQKRKKKMLPGSCQMLTALILKDHLYPRSLFYPYVPF